MSATTREQQQSVEQNQPHRIVAESDLEALRTVWQPPSANDQHGNNDHMADEGALSTAVDAAVWELLLQMVHPVPDRTYADCTLNSNDVVVGKINFVAPPDDTWEAWVDSSALDRVRQLRSQVRQKAASVQQKRQQVLTQVDVLTKRQGQPTSSQHQPPLRAPVWEPTVQEAYVRKAKETQSAVDGLVQDMDALQVKIPTVVQRFQETLLTVQDETTTTGRQGRAERAILVAPDDVMADEDENKAPAQDRLLRFLATQ